MTLVRMWMPAHAEDRIQCRGSNGLYCSNYIASGDIYSLDDWHVQYIGDRNNWPSASSIKCFKCTVVQLMSEVLVNSLDPAHPAFAANLKEGLANLCKLPVREELHKIIREECADPNGPISTGEGASAP